MVSEIKEETRLISRDLRWLFDQLKANKISREQAESLANISGKNLRAQAILLMEDQSKATPGRLIEGSRED